MALALNRCEMGIVVNQMINVLPPGPAMVGMGATLGIVGILIALFGFSGILLWTWNLTMPDVFGLKPLRYWQAFRLVVIVGMLFGLSHFV